MRRVTDQDRHVAARILPRLHAAVTHIETSEMDEETRSKCTGAIVDAFRLLTTMFDELGIEYEM